MMDTEYRRVIRLNKRYHELVLQILDAQRPIIDKFIQDTVTYGVSGFRLDDELHDAVRIVPLSPRMLYNHHRESIK